MVDKDNTHFSYKFECDKVIDGVGESGLSTGERMPKLVIMKKTDDKSKPSYPMETIAVFATWTFWRIISDNAKKCTNCGRFEELNKQDRCKQCQEKVNNGEPPYHS